MTFASYFKSDYRVFDFTELEFFSINRSIVEWLQPTA